MTDYTDILPETPVVLERTPADSGLAMRSHEKALLLINEDGLVSIRTRTYYGGDATPIEEWNRRTLTYGLASSAGGACVLDMDRLKEDLAEGGRLASLIDRIRDGHEVMWNGHNFVGRITADAEDADIILQDLDYTADEDVWDAYHWVMGDTTPKRALASIGLSETASEEQISATARALLDDARRDGVVIAGDMEEALRRIGSEAEETE